MIFVLPPPSHGVVPRKVELDFFTLAKLLDWVGAIISCKEISVAGVCNCPTCDIVNVTLVLVMVAPAAAVKLNLCT